MLNVSLGLKFGFIVGTFKFKLSSTPKVFFVDQNSLILVELLHFNVDVKSLMISRTVDLFVIIEALSVLFQPNLYRANFLVRSLADSKSRYLSRHSNLLSPIRGFWVSIFRPFFSTSIYRPTLMC